MEIKKNNKCFFSIAIPTYEMNGKGDEFLENNFIILKKQNFNDFNIVISDHSINNDIENLCQRWNNELDIIYLKNENNRGSSSANLNNAIKNSNGQYIKIIFQDDFLYNENSLQKLYNHIIKNNFYWYVTSYTHTENGYDFFNNRLPVWEDAIFNGFNVIGSPSILTIKNVDDKLFFNEELIWMMDVDYYLRMHDKFNDVSIIDDINVVSRIWDGRVTNKLSDDIKNIEFKKYNKG